MKTFVGILTFCLILTAGVKQSAAQIDFDRPDVIQTSFMRQIAKDKAEKQPSAQKSPAPASPNFSSNQSDSYAAAAYDLGYGGYGYGNSYDNDCCGCNSGCEHNYGCTQNYCSDNFGECCESGSTMSLTVSGIVDIPLDGVFHTGDDASVTAAALGVPGGLYGGATPFDLLVNEMGFEDIYRTFGGFEANLNFQRNCNTSFFIGYRFVEGRNDNFVTVGSAVANPLTTPTTYDINAQFSEYRESQLQAGFLNSYCLRGRLDFLWGGRMGIGFVDEINVNLDIPTVVTLNDVRFYDDTTNFAFGFNLGLRMNLGCRMKAHVLTGAEYRSSLNQFDTQLATLGLEELNNGSGFTSLPVYMGFSYCR